MKLTGSSNRLSTGFRAWQSEQIGENGMNAEANG
jgi:hypothetical protein